MFSLGLFLFAIGFLAEMPATVANLQGQPRDLTMQCLIWIGMALCIWGLYRMSMAKWRHWGVAFLALPGAPGALLGLVVVLLLKNRNPGMGMSEETAGETRPRRAKARRRSV